MKENRLKHLDKFWCDSNGNIKILMAEHAAIESTFKVGCNHYVKLFSEDKNTKIFYLSGPVSLFHLFLYRKSKNIKNRFKIWLNNGKYHKNNLFEYIPLTLFPIHNLIPLNSKWVINNNLRYTLPPLKRILTNKKFNKVDILFIGDVIFHSLLDIIDAKLTIYRITDDISFFNNLPNYLKYIEEKVIKKADIVIVTSKTLLNKVKKIRKNNVYYIPNGADFEHFYHSEIITPEEYKNIPSPRIVYVGAIEKWFDVNLLKFCAEKLPNYSFVIIGPPKIKLSILSPYKNVFILGPKDYSLIPSYLKNSDVGIIPFKKIEGIDSVSPIKLYEYMACGLPVVSVEWEELKNSPAFLAKNKYEFVEMIEEALRLDNNSKSKFIEFAKENTWESRFYKIKKLLGL